MPEPGTCQHYGKFCLYQKYRTVASKRPKNWNLNVWTPFKQSANGKVEGKSVVGLSGFVQVNISAVFQPAEKKLKPWQTRMKHFPYLLLASHQPLDFKFSFFYLLTDCKFSYSFLTHFSKSHKRYLR